MKRFVSFVPEIKPQQILSRRITLSSGLYLLPAGHRYSVELRESLVQLGHTVQDGSYLYYEGNLAGDITPYEIFQGYCLALTFFHEAGRATCRAVKELGGEVELHIDEFDKFRYGPKDEIVLRRNDIVRIAPLYRRVLPELATRDFNPLRNSLEFFTLFISEPHIKTRLLYLSICLESLLLEGNDNEGIAYKLGLRCASFLHHCDRNIDLASTFSEVRNGYTLRSKIIHGGDYDGESENIIKKHRGKATKELDHILILEKIVKNVHYFILSDQSFLEAARQKTLGKKIDGELLLERS